MNNQGYGQKNQSATEREGPTSSSECREGTGMVTETPGSRGFEQGQIGCGQELRQEGQNQARERIVSGKLPAHTHTYYFFLTTFYSVLFYHILCCAALFHFISLLLPVTTVKY